MSRILAIDYGEKRIGIALSDETKKIALPKEHILNKEKVAILRLIAENEVDEILIGLPKNLAGQETTAAGQVRRFASWLKKSVKLPIHFIDERFTTREAAAKLRGEHRLRGPKLRAAVDSMSAQILLQAYLQKAEKLND